MRAAPEQDVHGLLEAALLQGPVVCAVDAVPRDGHEMTAAGHRLAQNRQVPVVHVRPIKLDHTAHLLEAQQSLLCELHTLDIAQRLQPSVQGGQQKCGAAKLGWEEEAAI